MRRQIRKYDNRKMYDADSRGYVSMLGLSDLVADGARVAVTCDRTGRDITAKILARALYERLRHADGSAGSPVLVAAIEGLIARVPRR